MTHEEFETRTGLTVNEETFWKINDLYIACSQMDKDAFCAAYIPGMEENPIIADLLLRIDWLTKSRDAYKKDAEKAAHYLLDAREEHGDDSLFHDACDIIDAADAIRYIIDNEYELGHPELEYIKENLK